MPHARGKMLFFICQLNVQHYCFKLIKNVLLNASFDYTFYSWGRTESATTKEYNDGISVHSISASLVYATQNDSKSKVVAYNIAKFSGIFLFSAFAIFFLTSFGP